MMWLAEKYRSSFEKFDSRTLINLTSDTVDGAKGMVKKVDGMVERVWHYCLGKNTKEELTKKKKKEEKGRGRDEKPSLLP